MPETRQQSTMLPLDIVQPSMEGVDGEAKAHRFLVDDGGAELTILRDRQDAVAQVSGDELQHSVEVLELVVQGTSAGRRARSRDPSKPSNTMKMHLDPAKRENGVGRLIPQHHPSFDAMRSYCAMALAPANP